MMEIKQSEIDRFNSEKLISEKKWIEIQKVHKEIKKLSDENKLVNIKTFWHLKLEDIDFSKQRNPLKEELRIAGVQIIEKVNVELLLNKFIGENTNLFREKVLYNIDLCDWQISEILNYWKNGMKLIPPTIQSINNKYLFPSDGRHRLNIAYYYGVEEIPILVSNFEKQSIIEILNSTK